MLKGMLLQTIEAFLEEIRRDSSSMFSQKELGQLVEVIVANLRAEGWVEEVELVNAYNSLPIFRRIEDK